MKDNVEELYPCDNFNNVLDASKERMLCGVVIGYDENNKLVAYAGGRLQGRQILDSDILWLVERFKDKLIGGFYDQ